MFKPTYDDRNRARIAQLAVNTRQAALKWYDYCVQNEIDVLITQTLRTIEEQRRFVAEGKSKTMRSYHLVGQALDFVPIVNGKANYSVYRQEPFFSAIQYAKKLGFEWGGDWKSFVDSPHLQFNYKGYGTDTFSNISPPTNATSQKPQPKPQPKPQTQSTQSLQLKNGSKGNGVKEVQKLLGITVDGNFGPKTEKAVKNFQKENGLVTDGIVGAKTRNALIKRSSPTFKVTVRRGSKGDAVKEIQRRLGLTVDGDFGEKTERAVKTFQKQKGLTQDGIVGPNTFKALFP